MPAATAIAAHGYVLHIGDKAYSSWSLRSWLLLLAFGPPFREQTHAMYDPAFDTCQAGHAPVRTVPMLSFTEGGRDVRVWDTLAIAETLAGRHPDAGHTPTRATGRATRRRAAPRGRWRRRCTAGSTPCARRRQ